MGQKTRHPKTTAPHRRVVPGTGLPPHPSLYGCSPSLMGDNANAATAGEARMGRLKTIRVYTQTHDSQAEISLLTAQVLLPPAEEESASSNSSTLLNASVSAMTGLCQCLIHSSCRTTFRLMIFCRPALQSAVTFQASRSHIASKFFHNIHPHKLFSITYQVGFQTAPTERSVEAHQLLLLPENPQLHVEITRKKEEPGTHVFGNPEPPPFQRAPMTWFLEMPKHQENCTRDVVARLHFVSMWKRFPASR